MATETINEITYRGMEFKNYTLIDGEVMPDKETLIKYYVSNDIHYRRGNIIGILLLFGILLLVSIFYIYIL